MSGGDQFNPPGRVLFRIPFNVDAANAADFTRFIEDVVQRLRNLIQHPRHFGRRTTALPCPQAAQRTWFVIELRSRDREMRYNVPIFIEAETIYLHGYQNQHGEVFEFQRNSPGDNLPPPGPYLGGTSRYLSFSCNYEDLERSTQKQDKNNPDLGLALRPLPDPGREPQQAGSSKDKDEKEVPRPNFGRERLIVAVRELAEGRNLHGQSQHRTAQNLLLVIIRFNESIRFRSICDAMKGLWTVQSGTGQPSRCLNKDCFGQIKNWNKLAINLQDSARRHPIWPSNLAKETGVRSAAEARGILVLVMFHEDENEPYKPDWIPPPPDNFNNNNRRRHGGPGGGAAGGMGVYAAELPVPRWLPMPQSPVLEISAIHVLFRQDLTGVYGTVTVNNGLGAQQIFRRRKDEYQRYLGYSKMTLPLSVRDRSFSAADSWGIFLDLWNAATDAPVSMGRITWSICDFSSNIYDRAMTKTIGQAVVEYVVHSSAMEDDNDVVVDNDDGITFELLGPAGSSRRPADYFRYGMVDGTGTTPGTSSSAGRPHEHDDLRRRRR